MKRSSGIRLCATVAVSALSLALITGCSDGGSDKAESNTGNAAQGSEKSTVKALTAAELKKLILAKSDLVGYEVAPVDKSVPATKTAVTVDKQQCRPLGWAMAAQPPGDAASATNETVTEAKKASPSKSVEDMTDKEMEDALNASLDQPVTIIGLSSYDGDGAGQGQHEIHRGRRREGLHQR
jgi:hypothetical protein